MKVAVVVPTYNERQNVKPLLEAVKAVGIPDLTVLFVDDSSPDGTSDLVQEIAESEPWVRLHKRKAKEGLGRAYLDGIRQAVKSLDPDVVVIMDGDLQHPPATIRDLLGAIDRGADFAIGSRYVRGGGVRGWTAQRRIVSLGANFLVRVLVGIPTKDCTSGFRAYRRSAAEYLLSVGLPAKGFEFNVFSVKIVSRRMKVVEVPFVFRARKFGKSKLRLGNILEFLVSVVKISVLSSVAPSRGY